MSLIVSNIVEMSMNKITLQISVHVDDLTAERAIMLVMVPRPFVPRSLLPMNLMTKLPLNDE